MSSKGNLFLKNKKAVSMIIGYVLLIAVSIVMSIIVYQWIKTYVPTESLECSDGTSIFIRTINYDCENSTLSITLKNNGKFSINGIYVRVSNISGEELAPIDISSRLLDGGVISATSIVFSELVENALTPSEPSNLKLLSFNISGLGQLYKIEVVPIRLQVIDDKKRSVSCSNAIAGEILTCTEGEVEVEPEIGYGTQTNPGTSCLDIYNHGIRTSGVYWATIGGTTRQVYCDMISEGGGWTLLDDFVSTINGGASQYSNPLSGPFIDSAADLSVAGWTRSLTTYDSTSYTRTPGYLQMFYSGSTVGYISKALPSGYSEVYIKWGNWYSGTATLQIGGSTVQTLTADRGAAIYRGNYNAGAQIRFSESGIFWVGEIWVR